MRRTEFFDDLAQDTRYALRTLRKSPLFTLITIATIAIGIGASTSIFSVVDAVLLQSLPYAHADQTVVLWNSYEQTGLEHAAVAAPEYFDYKNGLPALDEVAALRPVPTSIVGDAADPEQIVVYSVTPNLFSLLGATPALGRSFAAGEGAPGGENMVILSYGLWMRRFGGDSSVLHRSIRIGGVPRVVIGIMGREVRFPDEALGFANAGADAWIPNTLDAQRTGSRGNQNLVVIGRLRPGVSTAALTRDMAALERRFKTDFPDRYASVSAHHWRIVAVPLLDEMVGAVRPALLLLFGAVGILMLIACANVASLLLARATLRRGEMAVRLALGAGRARLLRQVLTESTVLSLAGGVVGVLGAWVALRTLTRMDPGSIPRLATAQINGVVLAFSLGASLLTGLMVGIMPAIQQSRMDLRGSLNDGARGTSDGKSRRRMRTALVVAEVALALVILNCAALFGRSFIALQQVQTGFRPAGVMSMYVSLPTRTYDSAFKMARFSERLLPQLANIPGVSEASGIYPLPMAGDPWSGSFQVEGAPVETMESPHAEYAAALPGYFNVMGIQIVQGRDFTRDDNANAPNVVIVDEKLAAKYWPGQSALNKRLNGGLAAGKWATVIGVVRHVHSAGLESDGEPQLYLSFVQQPTPMWYPVVRTTMMPAAMTSALREAVRSVDADLPVSRLRCLNDVVRSALSRQRFNTLMMAVFGLVALGLASIGLYGVMSYLVAQRTREMGIRIALGGQPRDVQRVVVRESLAIAVVGLVIGTLGTLAMSRGLTHLLFGVTATDPLTYVFVASVLLTVTLAAAYVPARRATRVDPMLALRE